jgi:lysozyme family protein
MTYPANFERAFSAMMKREGGYVLHTVRNDRGGMTYAGIARKMNPDWSGWAYLDRNETPPTELVRRFYHEGYWLPIRGDELRFDIATSLFSFAVNTSAPKRPTVAVKLAQLVAGAEPDGVIGPRSVAALNAVPESTFAALYCIAKLKRYADIAERNPSQRGFIRGWLNRALSELEAA